MLSADIVGAIVRLMIGRYLSSIAATSAIAVLLTIAAPSSATGARPAQQEDPVADAVNGLFDGPHSWILRGPVGDAPAGMNLAMRNRTELEASHIYYGSDPTDIPLEIEIRGDDILLRDPGGGLFQLHLRGHSGALSPSAFDSAIGLEGSYTKEGRRVNVDLGFAQLGPRETGHGWYADVTDRPDAEFESRVRQFLNGVTTGNRALAAAAVSYPLRLNGRCPRSIPNRARLLRQWESIFTPPVLARLRTAIPHEMFVRNGLATIGAGEIWFDARGATAINGAGCPIRRARRRAS